MRISYLIGNGYAVGGTIRTVFTQAGALAAAGHEVEVVSVLRHRERPAFELDPRVTLRALTEMADHERSGPGWLRRYLHARPSRLVPPAESRYASFSRYTDRVVTRYLRDPGADVLVTTRPALNLLAARFATARVVRVGQEHLHLERHRPELAAEIARWYPRLDAVAVLTEADAQIYRAALGTNGCAEVVRIPNGIPAGERVRTAGDRKIVMAAGRLTTQKGFDLLVDAFALVAHRHPDWQLRIFGHGQQEGPLRTRIHERHLYNNILLMGGRSGLATEFAKASIFVLSSRHEGFGLVLLEAMSHAVPVVSFDCPHGPAEIITSGYDGLLVPPGRVVDLAEAITALIENEELRAKLGARGMDTATGYDIGQIGPRWAALFERLVAAKATPGAVSAA